MIHKYVGNLYLVYAGSHAPGCVGYRQKKLLRTGRAYYYKRTWIVCGQQACITYLLLLHRTTAHWSIMSNEIPHDAGTDSGPDTFIDARCDYRCPQRHFHRRRSQLQGDAVACVPMRHMQALLQHEIRLSTRIATLCVRHGTCIARKATYKAMLLCVVCVPMLPCCYQNYYTFQLQRGFGLYEGRSG